LSCDARRLKSYLHECTIKIALSEVKDCGVNIKEEIIDYVTCVSFNDVHMHF